MYLDRETADSASALCQDRPAFQSLTLLPITQLSCQRGIKSFPDGTPGCNSGCCQARNLRASHVFRRLNDLFVRHNGPLLQET